MHTWVQELLCKTDAPAHLLVPNYLGHGAGSAICEDKEWLRITQSLCFAIEQALWREYGVSKKRTVVVDKVERGRSTG